MKREQIADAQQLYRHSGTIHSLLHFVWLCGFARADLIGCDGISQEDAPTTGGGHDPRLENRSNSWANHEYRTMRQAQDLLIRLFGFEARYVGTPAKSEDKTG
jgi:hypothetical protein